jgi:fumarate reductase flavoprotein subunit
MVKSGKALAQEEGADDTTPKNYDVVVVGSGGAGLAAAIQAHDEGARVLIVEKCQPLAVTPSKHPPG